MMGLLFTHLYEEVPPWLHDILGQRRRVHCAVLHTRHTHTNESNHLVKRAASYTPIVDVVKRICMCAFSNFAIASAYLVVLQTVHVLAVVVSIVEHSCHSGPVDVWLSLCQKQKLCTRRNKELLGAPRTQPTAAAWEGPLKI